MRARRALMGRPRTRLGRRRRSFFTRCRPHLPSFQIVRQLVEQNLKGACDSLCRLGLVRKVCNHLAARSGICEHLGGAWLLWVLDRLKY
jgi:hypothetical protein